MNETTMFLAQIMGPTLGLLGLGMILNRGFYIEMYENIIDANLAYLLTSMAMLATGAAMVNKHLLWSSLPEILISIVGLSILIKGAAFAILPSAFKSIIKSVLNSYSGLLSISAVVWLIGGAYLSYVGYIA